MNAHTLVFDKLFYLDRLKSAGVSEEVARAHADGLDQALRESVATKSDVEAVRTDLRADVQAVKADVQAVKAELDAKIEGVERRLDAKIEGVELRLDAKIDTTAARLETKIAEAQIATTRWMVGSFVAMTGLFWALVKYAH